MTNDDNDGNFSLQGKICGLKFQLTSRINEIPNGIMIES